MSEQKRQDRFKEQLLTLVVLVLVAIGLYKWQGFEVTVILLLVFIWNITPTARDIREIVEQATAPTEADEDSAP